MLDGREDDCGQDGKSNRTSTAVPSLHVVFDPTAPVNSRIANRRGHGVLEAEWGTDGNGGAGRVHGFGHWEMSRMIWRAYLACDAEIGGC